MDAGRPRRWLTIGQYTMQLSANSFYRWTLDFCSQRDKQQHFWVSVLIVVFALPLTGLPLAVLLSAFAGLVKEVWDHYYGSGFCYYDLLADALGTGVAASVTILFL